MGHRGYGSPSASPRSENRDDLKVNPKPTCATSNRPRIIPPLRDRPELGVDELHVLVPRKAEVHEPLPVERPSEILEQLDPPLVDLDQLVEGGEDGGDSALGSYRREQYWELRADDSC